jgi:hypothetical protein
MFMFICVAGAHVYVWFAWDAVLPPSFFFFFSPRLMTWCCLLPDDQGVCASPFGIGRIRLPGTPSIAE